MFRHFFNRASFLVFWSCLVFLAPILRKVDIFHRVHCSVVMLLQKKRWKLNRRELLVASWEEKKKQLLYFVICSVLISSLIQQLNSHVVCFQLNSSVLLLLSLLVSLCTFILHFNNIFQSLFWYIFLKHFNAITFFLCFCSKCN